MQSEFPLEFGRLVGITPEVYIDLLINQEIEEAIDLVIVWLPGVEFRKAIDVVMAFERDRVIGAEANPK